MADYTDAGLVHDWTEYVAVRVFIILIYLPVIVIGAFGNIVVLVAICRGRGFGTTSNIFIGNLAVCDLYLLLIDAPGKLLMLNFSIGSYSNEQFSKTFCTVTTYVTLVVGACAVFTMFAISLERYIAVCRPMDFAEKCTTDRARIIVVIAWLFAAVSFIPMASMSTSQVALVSVPYEQQENENGTYAVRQVCVFVNKDSKVTSALYYFYVFSVFLVLPTVFVIYAYVKTFLRLRRQFPSAMESEKVLEERKKMSRMMLCVLIVFIISWLPYCIFCIISAFGVAVAQDNIFFSYLMMLWVIFLGSAIDPYIYSYYSPTFRYQLKTMLCFTCNRFKEWKYRNTEPVSLTDVRHINVDTKAESRSRDKTRDCDVDWEGGAVLRECHHSDDNYRNSSLEETESPTEDVQHRTSDCITMRTSDLSLNKDVAMETHV